MSSLALSESSPLSKQLIPMSNATQHSSLRAQLSLMAYCDINSQLPMSPFNLSPLSSSEDLFLLQPSAFRFPKEEPFGLSLIQP